MVYVELAKALNELSFCNEPFIDYRCAISKGLKVAHINVRSLRYKVDYLNILLCDNDIDILGVTETWLDSNIDDSEVPIDGYNLCRVDRKNENHGGIVCYIKSDLNYCINDDLLINDVESLWVEINLPHTKPIIVGTIYRVPDAKAEYVNMIDAMFQNCVSIYDDAIIVGDFNLDVCKSSDSRKISSIANHSQLTQLINDYTRVTETSSTIIDLAFVSRPETISSSGVHSLGISDHNLIYVVRKIKRPKSPPLIAKNRSFKNFSENDFVHTISRQNWDSVCNYSDVDSALTLWKSLFSQACDLHAPVREKRVKSSQPQWITSEFLSLCKDRDFYFAKAQKSNDSSDWQKAKMYRNKVNNMRLYLKKKYYHNSIAENVNNSRNLWSVIKKLLPSKSSSPCTSVICKNR